MILGSNMIDEILAVGAAASRYDGRAVRRRGSSELKEELLTGAQR